MLIRQTQILEGPLYTFWWEQDRTVTILFNFLSNMEQTLIEEVGL
jgi:hypothetical protein